MPQIDGTRLPSLDGLIYLLHTFEHHPALHLLTAERQQFERLYKIIAKETVEAVLYPAQLCLVFFGERGCQILPHHTPTITDNVVHQHIYDVGYQVMHSQR